jgi:hypothetical protein
MKRYREPPQKDWRYDTKSFFYNGIDDESTDKITYVAKSTKENILGYTLRIRGDGTIEVVGAGRVACRIARRDNKINLYIDNEIDYPDLSWGNYQRDITLDKIYSGKIKLRIK